MVQFIRGGLSQKRKLVDCIRLPLPTVEGFFELTLGVLDCPIVGCAVGRAIDWDYHGLFQYMVYREMIEIAAIVPFAKQGCAEPRKQVIQMAGNLFTAGK